MPGQGPPHSAFAGAGLIFRSCCVLSWRLSPGSSLAFTGSDVPEPRMLRTAFAIGRGFASCALLAWLAACLLASAGWSQVTHRDLMRLDEQARSLAAAGQIAEATAAAEDLIAKASKRLGADDMNVGTTHCFLGTLYNLQGRHADGERSLASGVAILRKYPAAVATLASGLSNLSNAYRGLGKLADAESALNEAIALNTRSGTATRGDIGKQFCNLADLVQKRGRLKDVEALARRCVELQDGAAGEGERDLPQALQTLADALIAEGRLREAEPLLLRSLAISERVSSPSHPVLARSLDGLANLSSRLGRPDEAEAFYRRSLKLDEETYGAEHPFIGGTLNNLANIFTARGHYAQAREAQERALKIFEKALGPGDVRLAILLNNIGLSYTRLGDWPKAYAAFQRAAAIEMAATTPLAQQPAWLPLATDRSSHANLAVAAWGLAEQQPGRRDALIAETFEAAQISGESAAGSAVAALAARHAAGNAAIATRVRAQQDLRAERQRLDASLLAAISSPRSPASDQQADALRRDIATVEARLAALATEIARDVPEFGELSQQKPLSLRDTQGLLRANEALVLYLSRDSEVTFAWIVTRSEVRWLRLPIGRRALAVEVAVLRCGLDATGWAEPGCERLTGTVYTDADRDSGKPLPFDHARAHQLYKLLFAGTADLLAGKNLILIPSGALSYLPFHVLLTAPPAEGREPAWLVRQHASSVLPSVAALKSLRRNTGTSKAAEPFIGFGDPALTGTRDCPAIDVPESCPSDQQVAFKVDTRAPRRSVRGAGQRALFRDGLADVAAVRQLCPLPDTAQELNCVARSLAAAPGSVLLGPDMTETRLKQMRLDRYRIIHFATHGLLPDQTEQISEALAEPALVMSPPEKASPADDGLLTASEIAALKLDADWVVMSACNTAGSDSEHGEALSGLARAFFYAGARALLVSHWPVNSNAATFLTSRTFAELRAAPQIGRVEAFRRAMLLLMSSAQMPWAAHPSYWAPFVVVGEGGPPAPF